MNRNLKIDMYGNILPDTSGMMFPVRHNACGQVHDSADVEVTVRYADATIWNCPNCGGQCDDRPIGWGGNVEKLY